jgi:hypothetical protein
MSGWRRGSYSGAGAGAGASASASDSDSAGAGAGAGAGLQLMDSDYAEGGDYADNCNCHCLLQLPGRLRRKSRSREGREGTTAWDGSVAGLRVDCFCFTATATATASAKVRIAKLLTVHLRTEALILRRIEERSC